MAEIRNDRDLLLQRAAQRLVPVVDPGAIIIPGYTGVVLTKNPDLFVTARFLTTPYLVSPDRMVLTAELRGIPINVPVIWSSSGNVILTDTGLTLIKTIEASNYPKSGSAVPAGDVTASVTYGGQTFTATTRIFTFMG